MSNAYGLRGGGGEGAKMERGRIQGFLFQYVQGHAPLHALTRERRGVPVRVKRKREQRLTNAPLDFLICRMDVRRMSQESVRQGPAPRLPSFVSTLSAHTKGGGEPKTKTHQRVVETSNPIPKKCTRTNEQTVARVRENP